jgi:Holliday junction resolvase-like predicted endonuclease
MIHESFVVAAVRRHLEAEGWSVLHARGATERGDDIIAKRGRVELRIEAKGEGSELAHTKRYGDVFTRGQVEKHVAYALYRAAKMRSPKVRAGMAFPDNAHHREMVAAIQGALDDLGIGVYWVNAEGVVSYGSTT